MDALAMVALAVIVMAAVATVVLLVASKRNDDDAQRVMQALNDNPVERQARQARLVAISRRRDHYYDD